MKTIVVILNIYGDRTISLLFYNNQNTESVQREMETDVGGPILTQKNIKGYTGQKYPYSTIWVKNIVVIFHIYGDRAIFLLFYNNPDNESEYWEMKVDVVGPIFTHKNMEGCMGQQYPYSIIRGNNIVVIFIHMEL